MESKPDLTKQYYYGNYAVTVLHELPNNTAKISVSESIAYYQVNSKDYSLVQTSHSKS